MAALTPTGAERSSAESTMSCARIDPRRCPGRSDCLSPTRRCRRRVFFALARDEVFVAQEYIRGLTITKLALCVWPARPALERESLVATLAEEFVVFWEMLLASGWFYGDMSADNLLVEPTGKLRLVDAGNAVSAGDEVTLTGFTPAFTSPRVFAAATEQRPIPGTIATILPCLGKIVHFALTGREQLNGHLPDLNDPALAHYSPHCRLVMELLADVDERPEKARDTRNAIAGWIGAIR